MTLHTDIPLTLRGPGGYQAWLVLRLLDDCSERRLPPLLLPALRQHPFGTLSGLFGIGQSGFGFAAAESPLFGALSTFWADFEALEEFSATDRELHMQAGGRSYRFKAEQPTSLCPQLRRRYLARQPAATGSWPAILRREDHHQCGHLTIDPQGLHFAPRRGKTRQLAKRGVGFQIREEEDAVSLSTDGKTWFKLWVENTNTVAESLRTELRSPTWIREAEVVCDLSHIHGSYHIELDIDDRHFKQVSCVSGKGGCVQFLLETQQEVEPWVAGSLDLRGVIGRLRLGGVVLGWEHQPDGAVLVTFCATAPLQDLNRRAHLRLRTEDRVGRCTTGSNRRVVEEALLLDLSTGGAGLWLSSEVPIGATIDLLLEVASIKGRRKRILFFPVTGTVVHAREDLYNSKAGWRVGIRFPKLEISVFEARQRVWLQTRDLVGT